MGTATEIVLPPVIASVAMNGLLVTGIWLWALGCLRRRARRMAAA